MGQNLSKLVKLRDSLVLYSADNSGSYPFYLEELVENEIMDADELVELNHLTLSDGMKMSWIVLGGLSDNDHGDMPLIVSPLPVYESYYAVATIRGSARLVSRSELDTAMLQWRHAHRRGGNVVPFKMTEAHRALIQKTPGGPKANGAVMPE